MVPQGVIEIAEKNPKILCNLGPGQRPLSPKTAVDKLRYNFELATNRIWVHNPVMNFLQVLPGGEIILLLFKWFDDKNVTVVLEVDQVFWDSCHYPRLDLKLPKDLAADQCGPKSFNEKVNIWGAFILAIAKANPIAERIYREDPKLEIFERLANEITL